MKSNLFLTAAILSVVAFTANKALAQCGAEGLDPCCGDPPFACKAGKRPVGIAAQRNSLTAKVIKERTALVRLQRQQAERLRLQRKKLAQIKNSDVAKLIQSLLEADRRADPLDLFPVADFTPGVKQTTYFSLLLDTQECSSINESGAVEKCYIVDGYHLYFDKNNVSDHIYVSRLRLGGMPENWAQQGFDWDLSYNEWVDLFKKLGYQTFPTEKPRVATRGGEKFFDAELMTIVKTPQGRMQITLDFTNGFGKTTADDAETLFSIIVDRL